MLVPLLDYSCMLGGRKCKEIGVAFTQRHKHQQLWKRVRGHHFQDTSSVQSQEPGNKSSLVAISVHSLAFKHRETCLRYWLLQPKFHRLYYN